MLNTLAGLLPAVFIVAMIVIVALTAYRATDGAAREDASDDARRADQAALDRATRDGSANRVDPPETRAQ